MVFAMASVNAAIRRGAGTYPRVLAIFPWRRWLTLPESIRQMTSHHHAPRAQPCGPRRDKRARKAYLVFSTRKIIDARLTR